jgi:hypothetical protein
MSEEPNFITVDLSIAVRKTTHPVTIGNSGSRLLTDAFYDLKVNMTQWVVRAIS